MCVLFLSFARKKKIPKRKGTGYVYGATPILPCADGARTRYAQTNRPLPAPDNISAWRTYAYARRLRDRVLRSKALCDTGLCITELCNIEPRNISPHSRRMVSSLTVGALSVESVFGVKKGRLFERSEFLPFSWKHFRSSPGSAALIFSLVSFFCIKAKESTIGYFFFFFRLPPKNKYINLHDIAFSSIFAQF